MFILTFSFVVLHVLIIAYIVAFVKPLQLDQKPFILKGCGDSVSNSECNVNTIRVVHHNVPHRLLAPDSVIAHAANNKFYLFVILTLLTQST